MENCEGTEEESPLPLFLHLLLVPLPQACFQPLDDTEPHSSSYAAAVTVLGAWLGPLNLIALEVQIESPNLAPDKASKQHYILLYLVQLKKKPPNEPPSLALGLLTIKPITLEVRIEPQNEALGKPLMITLLQN